MLQWLLQCTRKRNTVVGGLYRDALTELWTESVTRIHDHSEVTRGQGHVSDLGWPGWPYTPLLLFGVSWGPEFEFAIQFSLHSHMIGIDQTSHFWASTYHNMYYQLLLASYMLSYSHRYQYRTSVNGLPLKLLYCTNDLADFQCTRSAIFRDIVSKYTPNDREWIREHNSEDFKSISFTVLPPAPQKVEKVRFFWKNWPLTGHK